ncbi:hypothetical protein [Lacinutrix jangbogonensis]|uniref:hypothetical protein n=1 Tax=Lacinutrix jangbogonensis TaxID=1469557 RepID=UPI00053DC92B|nr:hypothetical protein [Lacinutrix jangbogonensis]
MKKLLCIAVLAMAFMNCEKDDDNQEQQVVQQEEIVPAKLLGTWEMYRDENLESIIDEWTGTEWTYVDQWFQNTREDSGIILEFREDGTFISRYVDVEVANGVWTALDDGRYYFEYLQEDGSINDALTERRYVTIHCDNTYSIGIEGNDRRIEYYRIMDTLECGDLITYNVE